MFCGEQVKWGIFIDLDSAASFFYWFFLTEEWRTLVFIQKLLNPDEFFLQHEMQLDIVSEQQ